MRQFVVLLLALVATALWGRGAPVPGPGGFSVYGVRPGMTRAQVVAREGLTIDWKGNRVLRVYGDKLERDGRRVLDRSDNYQTMLARLGKPAETTEFWGPGCGLTYSREHIYRLSGSRRLTVVEGMNGGFWGFSLEDERKPAQKAGNEHLPR